MTFTVFATGHNSDVAPGLQKLLSARMLRDCLPNINADHIEVVFQHGCAVAFEKCRESRYTAAVYADEDFVVAFSGQPPSDVSSDDYLEEIAHAWRANEGSRRVPQDNGPFALFIYDSRQDKFYFQRDMFGQSPLCVSANKRFVVAAPAVSAITRVLRNQSSTITWDKDAFQDYMVLGAYTGDSTPITEIHKIPPGVGRAYKNGSAISEKREQILISSPPAHPDELAERLAKSLDGAIGRRVSKNQKIALLLSSGADSIAVAYALAKHTNNVTAICIGDIDPEVDESKYAMLVASILGMKSERILINDISVEKIESIYGSFGEPYGFHSLIPSHFAAAAVAGDIVDVATGDGGDGLFGIGNAVRSLRHQSLWTSSPSRFLKWAPAPIRNAIRRSLTLAQSRAPNRLRPTIEMLRAASYRDWQSYFLQLDAWGRSFSPSSRGHARGFRKIFSEIIPRDDDLSMHINAWHLWYFETAVMPKISQALSYYGKSVFSPLLDRNIVSCAAAFPVEGKFDKQLFRKIVGETLFRDDRIVSILQRKKAGFGFPARRFVRNTAHSRIAEVIFDCSFLDFLEIDRTLLRDKFQRFLTQGSYDRQAWLLYCAAIWHQKQRSLA